MKQSGFLAIFLGLIGAGLVLVPVFAQSPQPPEKLPGAAPGAATTVPKLPEKTKAFDARREAPVARPVEGPRRVAVPRLAGAEAQVRPGANANVLQEEFWAAQLRPLLNAELYFVHATCGLTREQRKPIQEAGEQGLIDAAKLYAIRRLQHQMPGGRLIAVTRADHSNSDPRKPIQVALAKAVQIVLRPEQATRFQQEFDERIANRKRGVVLSLVAKLDARLLLNANQRDRLCASLDKDWTEVWEQLQPVWQQSEDGFPATMEASVTPVLDARQQRIWQGLLKISDARVQHLDPPDDTGTVGLPWDEDDEE